MDRHSMMIFTISLLMISSSLSVLFPVTGSGEPLSAGSPSRYILEESENNDNWQNADRLTYMNNSYELHGNISSGTDQDHFYLNLQGGNGPLVDQLSIIPNYLDADYYFDILFVLIYAFYPTNSLTHGSDDEVLLSLRYYDEGKILGWSTAQVDATYTGIYGVRIVAQNGSTNGAPISGSMLYNFTISISQVAPADNNNDESNPPSLNTSQIAGSLDQDLDFMDWFKVTAPNPVHPTVVDMTITPVNPVPQVTSGSVHYGIEIDVYVKYNSRSSPGTFQTQIIRISPHPTFQSAGLLATPYDLHVEKNCTEIYIGLILQSYGLDSRNPNLNSKQYTRLDANTAYSLNVDVHPDIPNNRPLLLDGQVEPVRGRSSDIFTFSVIYRDVQNETPAYVGVWLDGEHFRRLTPLPGEGSDRETGVRYGVDVLGSQIGKDAYHHFNFSAYDGRDWATDRESGVKVMEGPIVDDNLPPQSEMGDTAHIKVMEDSDTTWLILDKFFSDPDIGDVLTYSIMDENGQWGMNLQDENLTASIVNNGSVAAPEWRLKIDLEPNVNGHMTIRVNATDNSYFPRFAELGIILDVEPVNDPPEIKRVGSLVVEKYDTMDFYKDQGERVEVSIIAEDIDAGDILEYSWDIGEVLKDARKGTTYDWDPGTGDLWFVTSDGDVPEFRTTLTVSDGHGGSDHISLNYYINNVNDPPVIHVPSFRSTIEGEYLYINPTSGDPDIDSGDIITFSYDLGALDMVTPSSAIEFSPFTGRLVLKAASDRMNGEWEINITVVDLAGASDWGICRIKIDNVNDPPVAFSINLEQQDENLTVVFHTAEVEDEDVGDVHTYIWDFGDGSDPVSGVDLRDISHTFPTAGAYTVTMKVFDGEAFSEVKEILVSVTAPPPDPDIDGDGMPNDWELRFGLDPRNPDDAGLDSDGDGLTNLEEFRYYEKHNVYLNPRNPDSDGDGFNDGKEVRENFDPLDPSVHPVDPNKDLSILLWIGGMVFLLLMFPLIIVLIVMKIRNRIKPVAAPVAVPAPYEQGYLGAETYGNLSASEIPALPGAEGYQTTPDNQYYYRQEPGQQAAGEVQEESVSPPVPMEKLQQLPEMGMGIPGYGEGIDSADREGTGVNPDSDGVFQDQTGIDPYQWQEPPETDVHGERLSGTGSVPEPVVDGESYPEPVHADDGNIPPDEVVDEEEKDKVEGEDDLPPPPPMPDI